MRAVVVVLSQIGVLLSVKIQRVERCNGLRNG